MSETPEVVGTSVIGNQVAPSAAQSSQSSSVPELGPSGTEQAAAEGEAQPWGVMDFFEGYGFNDLWGAEEYYEEDADEIGDAFESSMVGSMLGADDTDGIEAQGLKSPGGALTKKKLTGKGLISNFVLSIIGTTTLGLSSQMKKGGWFLPPLMLLIGGVIVAENTRLVTATIDKLQREKKLTIAAFPDFAHAAFGIWGKRVSSVTSMCALLGMTFTFLVLEAQNFNFVMPITWPWFGCNHCGRQWWALLLTPVSTVYVFGNPGALMRRMAAVGPLICILTVVFAWAGGAMALSDQGDMPEGCRPEHTAWPKSNGASTILELSKVGSYGFFSFAVIVTVPTLRNQMKEPKKTAPGAILAYILSLFMFAPIMFLGYAGFGDLVPENLIHGMRHNRPTGWWALNRPFETGDMAAAGTFLDTVVTLNILMTEAIYIPCTILAIEASFPKIFRAKDAPKWAGTAMRLGFIFIRFIVATSIDSFTALSSLVSSLFCVCNNILFPVIAFHHVGTREVGTGRKVAHGCIVAYGVFIMLLGTMSSFAAVVSPPEIDEPGSFLRPGISAECILAFHAINGTSIA